MPLNPTEAELAEQRRALARRAEPSRSWWSWRSYILGGVAWSIADAILEVVMS